MPQVMCRTCGHPGKEHELFENEELCYIELKNGDFCKCPVFVPITTAGRKRKEPKSE